MQSALKQVVPWGRSADEYERMFGLTDRDVPKILLGCGDGPASFNACWTRRGGHITSIDPIYRFGAESIRRRIGEVRPMMEQHLYDTYASYDWSYFTGVRHLVDQRLAAMEIFLEDFEEGRRAGRYVAGGLPRLPFPNDCFDLALCSHYLFTYGDRLDRDTHVRAVFELLRVAREVRVYPLVEADGRPSEHVAAVCRAVENAGFVHEVCSVDYSFQTTATAMLRVRTR